MGIALTQQAFPDDFSLLQEICVRPEIGEELAFCDTFWKRGISDTQNPLSVEVGIALQMAGLHRLFLVVPNRQRSKEVERLNQVWLGDVTVPPYRTTVVIPSCRNGQVLSRMGALSKEGYQAYSEGTK